jgi:hypothetical protein
VRVALGQGLRRRGCPVHQKLCCWLARCLATVGRADSFLASSCGALLLLLLLLLLPPAPLASLLPCGQPPTMQASWPDPFCGSIGIQRVQCWL